MPAVFLYLEKLPTWSKDWQGEGLRPKHITAWTKNAAENFCMRLRSSACIRIRPHPSASACVCVRVSACVRLRTEN